MIHVRCRRRAEAGRLQKTANDLSRRSHGVYIEPSCRLIRGPRRSWIAQHYSLKSSCWGTYFWRKYVDLISGMVWLHWRRCCDVWLTHLSSVSLPLMGSWAWSFRLVHGWLSETDLVLHCDVRRILWQLLVLLQRCKLHCTTTKVLPLYACFISVFPIWVIFHAQVKSLASETVKVAMVD